MTGRLHHPAGTLAADGFHVRLDPATAGWTYSGLQVIGLAAGEVRTIRLEGVEAVVLPLGIVDLHVDIDGVECALQGRTSVFARVSDFAYAPLGATVTLTATSAGDVAIATARCERRLEPRYGAAADVVVTKAGPGTIAEAITSGLPLLLTGGRRLLLRGHAHHRRQRINPSPST